MLKLIDRKFFWGENFSMTKKRICLVTGGTRGIGATISRTLLEQGYTVIANYHKDHQTAHSFNQKTNIPVIAWNVADFQLCKYNIDMIVNQYGPIDILVHNAGIISDAFCHKMSVEAWNTVIQTNLMSCFYLTNPLLASMRERKFGRLIFISSVNAEKGQIGQSNYCASKAGMIGFMKAMALEGAQKGITANAIAPGYIDTDMTQSINSASLQNILPSIPLSKFGSSEDVARCVLFLCSDYASYITGETMHVNGGQYMA